MKPVLISLFVLLSGFLSVSGFSRNLAITKVGEWGNGPYRDVFVKGNYAYCTAGDAGIDIIDIRNPSHPVKVGSYDTPGFTYDVYVNGNYAYVADGSEGLQIIDVSNPSSPFLKGYYYGLSLFFSASCVYLKGHFAYIGGGRGLHIIDVSDPSSPFRVGHYMQSSPYYAIRDLYVKDNYVYAVGIYGLEIIDVSVPSSPYRVADFDYFLPSMSLGGGSMEHIHVSGTYAYVSYFQYQKIDVFFSSMLIIDVSTPSTPTMVGEYTQPCCWNLEEIFVRGNYVYITGESGVQIMDISIPSSAVMVGAHDTPGAATGIYIKGQYAYVADEIGGLQVFDVSSPSSPTLTGSYDKSGNVDDMYVRGNLLYMASYRKGIKILDVSNPYSPKLVGSIEISNGGNKLHVSGDYAYLTGVPAYREVLGEFNYYMHIIDVSNPSSPNLTGYYHNGQPLEDVFVTGNYAYLAAGYDGIRIIDVSNPSSPRRVGHYETHHADEVYVSGNYAYVADGSGGLKIIGVSTPSSPLLVGHFDTAFQARGVKVSGQYAYITYDGYLEIVDVSNPSSPKLAGFLDILDFPFYLYVRNNYAYVNSIVNRARRLDIIDTLNPSSPTLLGHYNLIQGTSVVAGAHGKDNYIYVGGSSGKQLLILHIEPSKTPPEINLSRNELNFSYDQSGGVTGAQAILISNSGGDNLAWSASVDQYWLHCSPSVGNNSAKLFISVAAARLSPGTYSGSITFTDQFATNSPQKVKVTLKVYGSGQTSKPFGTFATPIDGSTVRSSVPVTGWVLDDIGVQCVQLFREANGSLVYIGDAVFVEGARPDVQQAYPGYPMNYKAGWGYMMLTNFLPNNGNGTFNIHALATDTEGNQVTLGIKTIICDNANAVKPFGAMDTPTQGGIASGNQFINWGWVLTPQPNSIPTDGSTINVWVDGVNIGHPTYNNYRADIAGLFPGYANSDGAVGYFYLDTTAYENGVHTIQWTAADDAGNTDGIGSRYFTIQNSTQEAKSTARNEGIRRGGPLWPPISDGTIPIDYSTPVRIKKGYNKNIEPQTIYHDENGNITVEIKELERLQIHLFDPEEPTLNVEHRTLEISSLPIGSTLDAKRGVFYWQPGVGFVGQYRFVFIATDHAGNQTRKNIVVSIKPRFSK